MHNLEAFIDKIEHIIFQPSNRNKNIFRNVKKTARDALNKIKTESDCCIRVQDKGSRFMILSNEDYCSKMTTQIERGSFFTLLSDINKSFQKEVEDLSLIKNGQAT